MIQILREEPIEWPDWGPMTVVAPPVALTIPISPTRARRKANGYLAREVAMTLLAHNPRLVVAAQPVWRFDIDLCLPNRGRVATLGTIDVDAEAGNVVPFSADAIDELLKAANALAASFASPATTNV